MNNNRSENPRIGGNGITDISYSGIMRGVVKRRDDPLGEGRVAVYIPKLMTFSSTNAKPEESKVTPGSGKYSPTSEVRSAKPVDALNYLWCRPVEYFSDDSASDNVVNGSYRVPQLEQTVFVFFEDEDPQKPYFYPYGPTKVGQVIPMSNMESSESNIADVSRKPNIHILSELPNGNIIGFDYNTDTNSFVVKFQNGHKIRIMKGNDGNKIEFVTENGNLIEINDEEDNINVNVNNDMNADVGNNIVVNVGNNANIKLGGSANVDAGSSINLKAGSSINLQAGSSINLKAPSINKGA